MARKAYQIAFAGKAAEDGFYGEVMELSVEENTATAGVMRLRLATALQNDGTWSRLDDPRLAPFARISVRIGFTGGQGVAGAVGGVLGSGGNDGLEPVFDGYVTAIDLQIGSQTGRATIEVTASDTSVLLGLEEKARAFTNLSDGDIVEHILREYGLKTLVDGTATVHRENDTVVVQRATDLQFIRSLARRNGREFYFETDKKTGVVTAHCHAPQLDGTPQADLAIRFGDASNLASFAAKLSALRPLTVKVTQTDVKSKRVNTARASATDRTKLGREDLSALTTAPLNGLVRPRNAQAQLLLLGPPTSDQTELQTIAQAVRNESAWLILATGEITSDAYQAVLRPRRTVLVKGAGMHHSGTYYITRVTHTLKSDGSYVQSFEGCRNARTVTGDERFDSGESVWSVPTLEV